jgi:hypothetical protein
VYHLHQSHLSRVTGTATGSTATAAAGYHFVNWTDKDGNEVGTNDSYTPAKVDGLNVAATYTANFAEDDAVTIIYAATTGGSVSPTSESLKPVTGTATGSTATAAAGYHFVNWTDKDGNEVGTNDSYTPAKVDGLNVAATYTANFAEDDAVTITYAATTGGSVSPTSESLKPVTGTATGSTATAAAGYHFVNWTDKDGNEVGTNDSYTPAKVDGLNVAATYTANFAEDDAVTITYAATTGGSVSPTSESLKPVTGTATGSTATAAAGYHFAGWTKSDGTAVAATAEFKPDKNDNGIYVAETYTAHFAENDAVTIMYESENINKGTVTPGSENVNPATGTASGSTATAKPGYHFTHWTLEQISNGGNQNIVQALVSIVKTMDETDSKVATLTGTIVGKYAKENGAYVPVKFVAHFAEDDAVTITYAATTGGSVSPTSESLKPVTGTATGSTATAAAGYHFVNWTDKDGNEVGTNDSYTPAKVDGLNVAATYTANFAEDDAVTITYAATTGGSVSPTSESLKPVTGTATGSTATAAAGYHFVNWTDKDGNEVGTNDSYTPAKVDGLNVAATYTANFAEDDAVTITYAATTGGSVSPTSESLKPVTGTADRINSNSSSWISFRKLDG